MNILRCFDENQMANNPHGFSCLPQKNDYNMVYKNVNVFIKKFLSTKYNSPMPVRHLNNKIAPIKIQANTKWTGMNGYKNTGCHLKIL